MRHSHPRNIWPSSRDRPLCLRSRLPCKRWRAWARMTGLKPPEIKSQRRSPQAILFRTRLRRKTMDTATMERLRNRLLNRRDAVLVTIAYIERENKSYEKNADWRDSLTKKRRRGLLDYLSDSYENEKAAIETALDRILANSYGSCVKCNEPIGSGWLEAFPATESCFSCCRQRRKYPGQIISRRRENFSIPEPQRFSRTKKQMDLNRDKPRS